MSADRQLIDDLVTCIRVKKIFERYCQEGKRPTREEAADWLRSLGWQPAPLAKMLEHWGYDEEASPTAPSI